MTKDAEKSKRSFTLRLRSEVSDELEKKANSLGLSQTAYITMVLHKELKQKSS